LAEFQKMPIAGPHAVGLADNTHRNHNRVQNRVYFRVVSENAHFHWITGVRMMDTPSATTLFSHVRHRSEDSIKTASYPDERIYLFAAARHNRLAVRSLLRGFGGRFYRREQCPED
jgi:hypothetical protein